MVLRYGGAGTTAEVREVRILADVPARASQYRARQEARMQSLDMILFL